MRGILASRWINAVAALVGGLMLGFGVGRFAHDLRSGPGTNVAAATTAVFGLILLWWSLSYRRKAERGDPENETDGSHTLE